MSDRKTQLRHVTSGKQTEVDITPTEVAIEYKNEQGVLERHTMVMPFDQVLRLKTHAETIRQIWNC